MFFESDFILQLRSETRGRLWFIKPQYVSAYGRMKSETQANRFAITIEFDDQSKQEYVLKQNWFFT